MSFSEFTERMEKSKSYMVTNVFLSAIPSELYANNAMNIPATAEWDLYNACMGKFASDKDECDFYRLIELIVRSKPIYPLSPVVRLKDVVGLTFVRSGIELTLNLNEIRALAKDEIFGIIEMPNIKINSQNAACIKGVFAYAERGGKITSIYQQSSGIQAITAMSASYINISKDGKVHKVRLQGTLTIPTLKISDKYRKFII